MKIVVQKVKKAVLYSNGEKYSEIGNGMLVLLGVSVDDKIQNAKKIADKILKLRIFDDENGKTNKSIFDIKGEIMLVSNFTLYGNVKGTNRPDFIRAARPEVAEPMYEEVLKILHEQVKTASGAFRTYMEIEMVADGPGTYIYEEI
ncbi:MAG: D-tyrosyl-tRNA(Tyr) deacylase [Clostridia bacterium]|nr:D-tyrosyl-tRNA(Tyr) deacylase [Clostridia bacterium]